MDQPTPRIAELEQLEQALRMVKAGDRELLAAYECTTAQSNGPEANLLLAEIERRKSAL